MRKFKIFGGYYEEIIDDVQKDHLYARDTLYRPGRDSHPGGQRDQRSQRQQQHGGRNSFAKITPVQLDQTGRCAEPGRGRRSADRGTTGRGAPG